MSGGTRALLSFPASSLCQSTRSFKKINTFEVVGHLALPEVGAVLVTPDGLEHQVSAQGWM